MILLPHLQDPIADIYPASRPMRGWMEQINTTININDAASRGVVFVYSLSDLPSPAVGVITLVDNYSYIFTTVVDLLGNRIVAGRNTVIIGFSSENCRIKSTGLSGSALITSEWSLPLRDITLESEIIFDLDANGNSGQALDWHGVNLEGSTDVGTIANYNNFVASSLAFLGVSGLVFDGTFGTIAFIQSLFSGTDPGAIITVSATATITRRIRFNYSSFIVTGSGVGLDVSTSASIPVEGYILDFVNFSGGGTYTQGVLYSDNKSRWTDVKGVQNSADISGYYMNNNATATVISGTGTPVKAAGTTSGIAITQKFTNSANRTTFSGAITRDFKMVALMTVTSGANHQIGLYIAKNGTVIPESKNVITTNAGGRAESGAVQAVAELATNDYLEVFVENNTAVTDIVVVDLNVIVEAI